jgi:hypothetical protein
MSKPSGLEEKEAEEAAERDSPLWRSLQAEALVKNGQLAGACHQWIPAIHVYIYLLDAEEQKAEVIGMSWICGYMEFKRGGYEYCRQPVTRGLAKKYSMRAFKALPADFTQDIWDDMKQVGPMMHSKGRFGYYCIRGIDQGLKAYAPEGRKIAWMPRQDQLKIDGKVPSHGFARIDLMAGNAYTKEIDEEPPF